MSSSLTRVTGRAPALAAGLLVLAAAMPATAYAAESAPESPRTPASAVHEPGSAGAPAENAPKDTPAEAAEASTTTTEAAAADASAPTTSEAAETAETPEAAAAAEETAATESAESSSGSGYWDSLDATGSESASAAADAEAAETAESASSGESWHPERPERPGHEAPGAPASDTPRPAPPAPPSTAPSPIEGRTEGGSIILTNGDIVACAAVGDLRVHGSDGREYPTNGPGTRFTTTAGTEVVTIATGHVRVTVGGASAEIKCGAEGFPTVVGLPRTGASSDLAMLSLAGFGLVAAGGAVVAASRRTRRLGVAE